jgi:hypothetical protein
MISGVRDNALALACVRHGLPAIHGRGMDLLPREVTERWLDSFVRGLDTEELARAFRVVVLGLIEEIRRADETLARRLEGALTTVYAQTHERPSR